MHFSSLTSAVHRIKAVFERFALNLMARTSTIGNEKLVWNILATDLALGSDGGLYISDGVDGWNGTGKGRIYRFNAGKDAQTVEIEEVKSLLQGDWSNKVSIT